MQLCEPLTDVAPENSEPATEGGTKYLATPVAAGLVTSILALSIFLIVAHYTAGATVLTKLDESIATRLHAHAHSSPVTVSLFRTITRFGSIEGIVAFSVVVGVILRARFGRRVALGWAFAASGGLLHWQLKAIYERARPVFEQPFIVEPSWSYPSGHAMASLIGYGLLTYVAILFLPRAWMRAAIGVTAGVLVLAVGFSRVYLGAHFLSDVVGGFAVGIAWLAVCISGGEMIRRRGSLVPTIK